MTDVSTVCNRALRKVGITAIDEVANADQIGNAVDTLNMMLAAWELAGVDVTHSALASSDDFPLDAKYEEGTVYMLASRLSPDYQIPPSFDADDFFRKIQAAYLVIDKVELTELARLPGQYVRSKQARFLEK